MEKIERKAHRYGLVGRQIGYSFSKGYFTEKFKVMGLDDHSYENFDLETIKEFESIVKSSAAIKGFNVTIPYKEAILPYLSKIDPKAEKIGAVNTIKVTNNGLVGYNTDSYGFQNSLLPFLTKHHSKALILGTGGASKAVAFALTELGIDTVKVSRNPHGNELGYDGLTEEVLTSHTILVNCTPLGTHPAITEKPDIPYTHLNEQHLLFDLIYNPKKTSFLAEGALRGAATCNGLRMLELQAEKAWEIWNSEI